MALDFAAGCLGGCAGVLVGHPLDTIKVSLQTQDFRNPQYRGTFHCMKTIIARDSIRGLYRGISSPMAGVAFVNAIVFGVYGNVQRYSENPHSMYSHFMAGSVAGLAQSAICSPMELAKTRLQLQESMNAHTKHSGPISCLKHIWKLEGYRGVFKGLGITAARDLPGFSSYFVAYETLMENYPDANAFHTLMAGGLAGTFSWLISFPIDVVKSRLQADGMSGKPKYLNVRDCIRQSYHEEGIKFLSRGLFSTLLRAFPTNAACFLVVSWVLKFCNNTHVDIELQQTKPLTIFGTGSAPFTIPAKHDDYVHHLSHTVKSLVFLGAFSEAVCASEIIEMTSFENSTETNLFSNYYHPDKNVEISVDSELRTGSLTLVQCVK